jgi:cytochrome c-type biogenesis protein CcmH
MTALRILAILLTLALPLVAATLAAPTPALAIMGMDEPLSDEAKEARARDIARGLRCVVCQNQSIDDSEAPLARDMRRLVRERIAAGDSDDAVMGYMTDRYGDYVLMRPPFQPNTWVLWFAPAAIALAAVGGVAALVVRRRRMAADGESASSTAPLTAEEEAALGALLNEDSRDRNR